MKKLFIYAIICITILASCGSKSPFPAPSPSEMTYDQLAQRLGCVKGDVGYDSVYEPNKTNYKTQILGASQRNKLDKDGVKIGTELQIILRAKQSDHFEYMNSSNVTLFDAFGNYITIPGMDKYTTIMPDRYIFAVKSSEDLSAYRYVLLSGLDRKNAVLFEVSRFDDVQVPEYKIIDSYGFLNDQDKKTPTKNYWVAISRDSSDAQLHATFYDITSQDDAVLHGVWFQDPENYYADFASMDEIHPDFEPILTRADN